VDDPIARKAKNYRTAGDRCPFREWIQSEDGTVRHRVNARIRRIEETGNYGDCEPVGAGVYELKLDFGPGYRIYFGIDGDEIVLLGGGDKSTQSADILKAKDCWEDYNA
jgi:putative addiction module killer protein